MRFIVPINRKNRERLRLCTGPHWGSLQRSPESRPPPAREGTHQTPPAVSR